MKNKDILIEKNFQGALVASAVIHGFRYHRIYMGYSRSYVRTDFKKYVESERSKPN